MDVFLLVHMHNIDTIWWYVSPQWIKAHEYTDLTISPHHFKILSGKKKKSKVLRHEAYLPTNLPTYLAFFLPCIHPSLCHIPLKSAYHPSLRSWDQFTFSILGWKSQWKRGTVDKSTPSPFKSPWSLSCSSLLTSLLYVHPHRVARMMFLKCIRSGLSPC